LDSDVALSVVDFFIDKLKVRTDEVLADLNKSTNPKTIPFVIELNRKWRSGFFGTCKNFLEFQKSIQAISPDVLIINCELPELYGALLRFNGKLICVEHTTKPWTGRLLLGIIVRLVLKLKRAEWVTVIHKQRKVWVGGVVVAHLPNPYHDRLSRNRADGQELTLTFVGGLKLNKRPEWVIETGLEFNLSVQLFGDGRLRSQLEHKYQKLSNQVRICGFKSNPWDLISSKSLVIVPSDYEGDGLVVVEAIMSGNPLLLRDNEDLRRFGLDDKHYFRDLESLKLVVKQNLGTRFKNLVVSEFKTDELRINRSLQRVTHDWLNLILTRCHST
jgi:glycosyltransferase involved in cell wall biosynthesis